MTGAENVRAADGYLIIGDTPSLQPQAALAVSAWFKARSFNSAMTIAGRAQTGPPWQYPFLSWLVRINTGTVVEIDVGHGQSYTPSGWNVPALTPDEWHFVVMTFDGQRKILFLDGALIRNQASGSATSAAPVAYAPGRAILIGADESDSPVGDLFHGAIDDVRLFDRALDAEQVGALFREGHRRYGLNR